MHKLAAPLMAAALSGGVDVQLSKKEKNRLVSSSFSSFIMRSIRGGEGTGTGVSVAVVF